mmetsp:Transcript_58068/g.123165  ORF Transcript_58068/g.123165 Transcript_58068/m.123165 type:complete len:299 (+) Transcript_58068:1532-2428(+)
MERASTLGRIFRYGIPAPNDEAGNVGHFDELSNGRFLLTPSFRGRLHGEVQSALGDVLPKLRIGGPRHTPFPKGGGRNPRLLEGKFHGVSCVVRSAFAENPSILGHQHGPADGLRKRPVTSTFPTGGRGHQDGLSHHFLVLLRLLVFFFFFLFPSSFRALVIVRDSSSSFDNGDGRAGGIVLDGGSFVGPVHRRHAACDLPFVGGGFLVRRGILLLLLLLLILLSGCQRDRGGTPKGVGTTSGGGGRRHDGRDDGPGSGRNGSAPSTSKSKRRDEAGGGGCGSMIFRTVVRNTKWQWR